MGVNRASRRLICCAAARSTPARMNAVELLSRSFVWPLSKAHHQESRSASTCCSASAMASAPTQQNTCPACVSLPATTTHWSQKWMFDAKQRA